MLNRLKILRLILRIESVFMPLVLGVHLALGSPLQWSRRRRLVVLPIGDLFVDRRVHGNLFSVNFLRHKVA